MAAPSRTGDAVVLAGPGAALEQVAATALRATPPGRVGLELEAHLVDLVDRPRRVPWDRVQAAVAALPPLPGGSALTLEPGGQVELSGPPQPDVTAAVAALRQDDALVRTALRGVGLGLAALGADPCRPPRRVSPTPRYAAMEEHFTATGRRGPGLTMMTSTASVQVNLEAGPEAGWADRVRLAQALGPVLVAVSACSPLLAGRPTGWRSSRQRVWAELDRARCGPLPGRTDPATEYARYALAAPVMLVRDDDGGATPVRSRVTFADWLAGARLGDRAPTAADLDHHLTTLFPPVRLRGFLEIRYLDAAPGHWWAALAAVTAVLLDDPVAATTAAAATEPVAGAWGTAARLGLADPQLHRAARACLAVAAGRVPAGLRREVQALADLVDRGGCPGDALLGTARTDGALAALHSATDPHEEPT